MSASVLGRARPSGRDWVVGILLGLLIGTVILGVGGRVAMRVFAHATNVPPGFSWGGTGTVVFLGAVSGAAGGAILALAGTLFPRRPFWRNLLFWGACVLIALRGLNPVDPLRLAVFMPVILLFAGALQTTWSRLYLPRPTDIAQGSANAIT